MLERLAPRGSASVSRWGVIGIAWLASIAGAMWVGRHVWPESKETNKVAESPGSQGEGQRPLDTWVTTRVAPAPAASVDMNELRQVIREELAQQLSSLPPPDPGVDTTQPESDPGATDPNVRAREDDALRFVDRAVASGRWTTEDRRRFGALAGGLPPKTIVELQRKVHVAINIGQLSVTDTNPPFGPPAP